MKNLTTTELNKKVFQYIIDNLPTGEEYETQLNNDTEKLQFIVNCFMSEYCYSANLKKYGTYQNTFSNWLMGLPSVFSVDFENYRILEIAKDWGSLPNNATEKQEDKILNYWYFFIASKFFQLCRKHKIDILNILICNL